MSPEPLDQQPASPGGGQGPDELHQGLARGTLGVLLIVGLIAASVWVLRPFLPAVIWATMIVVATWPLMRRIQAALWNRRALAVVVMTLALLLVFVLPFSLAIRAIFDNSDRFVGWAQSVASFAIPPPPDWLMQLPLVGEVAARLWTRVAAMDLGELRGAVAPYASTVAHWFLGQIGSFGKMLLQFVLTVIFAAIMYSGGERAADNIVRFGRRVAGERGVSSVRLAGHAIRGVAMGVVITALLQSTLGGIGLAICGVPFAAILTVVMFMLCIAQIGPVPVLVPAIIWMYWSGESGWGTVLLLWSLAVGSMDNVLRPLLIKRSADLPFLLIFLGVVGGLVAFGLIGIFIGPVVLAVAFTLFQAWIAEEVAPPGPPPQPLQ